MSEEVKQEPQDEVPGEDEEAASKPSEETGTAEPPSKTPKKKKDPITFWTRMVLLLTLLLAVWYLFAEKHTPYTAQARVRGFVVPITPEVSGIISEVKVGLNEMVEEGDVLVRINPRDFELAVTEAEASLEEAGQSVGSDTAAISVATAQLTETQSQLEYDQRQSNRVSRAATTGAVAKAEADAAASKVNLSEAKVKSAEASLEQARQQLGSEGRNNAQIRRAQAALEDAQLDLARTELKSPGIGGVTNVRLDAGMYAQAGQPLMTFVSDQAVWIEAYLRENSLGRVEAGDRVGIVLDVAAGRVFKGEVVSVGYGVQWGNTDESGDLPRVSAPRDWLRDPQRFPVVIQFLDDEAEGLRREGGQADVIVYTGDNVVWNALGAIKIRVISWLSHVR